MDKLSSILPSSPRVQSVDLSDAQPRRPGSPAFGMPMGTTAAGRARDRFTASKPVIEEQQPTYQNSKTAKSAKLVSDVTKSFFEKRLTPQEEAPTVASQAAIEEMGDAMASRSSEANPTPAFMVRNPNTSMPTSPTHNFATPNAMSQNHAIAAVLDDEAEESAPITSRATAMTAKVLPSMPESSRGESSSRHIDLMA